MNNKEKDHHASPIEIAGGARQINTVGNGLSRSTGAEGHGPLSIGHHLVTLLGVTVAYEVRGRGPVCVIHSGGPGIESAYLRMPEVEEHVTAVYIDPVGTGKSGRIANGDYSVENYAAFAHALIQTFPGRRAFFLGHSHGGFVALQLALDHAEDLLGVIVYDGAPTNGHDYLVEASNRMHQFAARFPGNSAAEDAEAAWVDNSTGRLPITDAASYLKLLQRMLPAYLADFTSSPVDPERMAQAIAVTWDPNRKADPWDIRGRLSSIHVRTLVIVGAYDFICGPRWASEMQAGVAAATLVSFDHSGHFAHLEEPTAFADSVGSFVQR